jgi:hypothetical protein
VLAFEACWGVWRQLWHCCSWGPKERDGAKWHCLKSSRNPQEVSLQNLGRNALPLNRKNSKDPYACKLKTTQIKEQGRFAFLKSVKFRRSWVEIDSPRHCRGILQEADATRLFQSWDAIAESWIIEYGNKLKGVKGSQPNILWWELNLNIMQHINKEYKKNKLTVA